MRLRVEVFLPALASALVAAAPAEAFLFPEHSRITQSVLEDLVVAPDVGPTLRVFFDAPELCAPEGDMNDADCLRLVADLSAIAADHTCSPNELLEVVTAANRAVDHRRDHWLWDVRRNAWLGDASLNGDSFESRRRLRVVDLETIGAAAAKHRQYAAGRAYVEDPVDRAFYRRRINLGFQAADKAFQSRAIVDSGHFQHAREPGKIELVSYVRQSLNPAVETNATALYATYHAVALHLAATATTRATRLQAFIAEMFALHFIEDSFSSGHLVGSRGIDSWLPLKSEGLRLGTHDHYSDVGLEVVRWNDLTAPYVAHGDGMMTPVDLASAAAAARTSLHEVLQTLADPTTAAAAPFVTLPPGIGMTWDSCRELHPAPGLAAWAVADGPFNDVIMLEPVPRPSFPEPTRFRAEAGVFFGVSAALDGGAATVDGGIGRAHAGLRGGVGLNGLTVDPINSIAFVEVGIIALGTNVGSHAQSDAGVSFRLRSPGLLTLAEGALVLGALGLGARPPWLIALGAKAGGGGLLPFIWQSHHVVGPWNFQVSALRDAAFNLYFRANERYRWEFQAPVVTLRTANAIGGISWAQSNDFWMDLGFSASRSTEAPDGSVGFYLSFSASARSFP